VSTAAAGILVHPAEVRRVSAGFWSDALWRLRHDPTTMGAFAVLLALAVLAIGADFLADNAFHWSFSKQDILNSYGPPSAEEPAPVTVPSGSIAQELT